MDIESLRRSIEILNERIRPIAEKPVEFGPDTLRGLRFPEPDAEVQAALVAAIDLYLESSAENDEEIRCEIAELSNDVDRYGFGSTKRLLSGR